MTISKERKELAYAFLDTPVEQREMGLVEFRKKHKFTFKTMKQLRIDWAVDKKLKEEREERLKQAVAKFDESMKSMVPPVYISDENGRWEAVELAIYQKALEGKVAAQELYSKLKGKLIDRKEIKVGLTDDEYYRIRREALNKIESSGDRESEGDREVRIESALLLEKPRVDSEQDNGQNG